MARNTQRVSQAFDQLMRPADNNVRKRDIPPAPIRRDPDPVQRDQYKQPREASSTPKNLREPEYPQQNAGANPVQETAEAKREDLAEQPSDPAAPAQAMTHTNPQPVGEAAGRPSPMAQLGAAAYANAPHGVGEQIFAEEAGLFPPGFAQPPGNSIGLQAEEMMPAAVFQEKTLAEIEGNLNGKPMTAVDFLNMSRKATNPDILGDEALMEEQLAENPFANRDVMKLTDPTKPTTAQTHLASLLGAEFENQLFKDGPKAPVRSGLAEYTKTMGMETAGFGPAPQGNTLHAANAAAVMSPDAAQENAAQMLERITQQARWMIRQNRQEVTMKLYPEHLGNMQLKVVNSDQSLRVDMIVDNALAKQMLEANMDELQARLQADNPNAQNFEFNVDVRQGNDPQHSETFYQTEQNSMHLGPAQAEDSLQAQETLRQTGIRWGTRGAGIYV